MEQEQFVNGNEIVDYWGYLNSVSFFPPFLSLIFVDIFIWFS